MKLNELFNQGIADRACGSFADLLDNIKRVDAEEATDKALAAYRLMWSTSEQLADIVKDLRLQGYRDLREMRVLSILTTAIEALEGEGLGS